MIRTNALAPLVVIFGLLSSCCCPSETSGPSDKSNEAAGERPPTPTKAGNRGVKAKRAFVKKHLSRLRKSSVCKKKKHRLAPICTAAKGFANAKPSEAPIDRPARLGVTIFVPTEGDVEAVATKTAHVSALGFSKEGKKYKAIVAGISQKNPAQKRHAADLLNDVLAVMKGRDRRLKPEANFYGYIEGLPAHADTDALPHDKGFFWKLERGAFGDVRKVGEYWVVLEAPRDPVGIYVSIFGDAPYSRGDPVQP